MTRHNHNKSNHTRSPSIDSTKDNEVNLPDLSAYRDDEKKHILNVLVRDEDLRNKHLSRFLQLRKEVADLEKQPEQTSKSVCARCQTKFGYIFNTGDACPKCGAKVCKQCRLMYNVNDNGWLCTLCCKQMQLMSYSGEWIYSIRDTLRKDSEHSSEELHDTFPRSVSAQHLNMEASSSDSEPEENTTKDRFGPVKLAPPPNKFKLQQQPKEKINQMVVQSQIDEDKLKFIKEHMHSRPLNATYTQPLPRRTRQLASPRNTANNSSDDANSVFSQAKNTAGRSATKKRSPPIAKKSETSKPIQGENQLEETKNNNSDRVDFDQRSVTAPETAGGDNKPEKGPTKPQRPPLVSTSSQQSLDSTTSKKSTFKSLTGSVQNIRRAVRRIPHPHLSSSRTSLKAENKRKSKLSNGSINNDEETISIRVPDIQNKSNSRTNLQTSKSSINELKEPSNTDHHGSSSTLGPTDTTKKQPVQRFPSGTDSIVTTNSEYNHEDSKQSKPDRSGSSGHLETAGDSDDDIDDRFKKAKLGSNKRTSSHMDIRGSQLSINSTFSENKARYDLDITGEIELKISYDINKGSLNVWINKCTNLASAKRNQTSNPYVKLYLLPDKSKASKRKTAVKKLTTNPVFEELLRYQIHEQEFNSRTLWVSVWSQATLSHNDFLGEIHIPLVHCSLDTMEEHTLLARGQNDNVTTNVQPTNMKPTTVEPSSDSAELYFELTYMENPKNKESGTIQVSSVEGKSIYFGKRNVDVICKGLLMPEKIKRKLPTARKGPSPKWDVPMRWEPVGRDNLNNTSVEISIWCQERFRKTMIGFIRLNSLQENSADSSAKRLDVTAAEKSAWNAFIQKPTQIHRIQLPLRPATNEHK